MIKVPPIPSNRVVLGRKPKCRLRSKIKFDEKTASILRDLIKRLKILWHRDNFDPRQFRYRNAGRFRGRKRFFFFFINPKIDFRIRPKCDDFFDFFFFPPSGISSIRLQ